MRRTLVTGSLLFGLLAAAGGAAAATPNGGARYLGFQGSETTSAARALSAKARVAHGGTAFARGSYVRVVVGCGRATRVALAGTQIRRGGFGKAKREGAIRYRLSGRFVTRGYATFRYSATSPARAHASARCRSGARAGALYQGGEPPFTGCRSQRARTAVQNADGRVFEQLRYASGDFEPFTYACLFSADRRVRLGGNGAGTELTVPRLAAPYVAFAVADCPGASCVSDVLVRNLRSGRLVKSLAATTTSGVPGDTEHVTDLELKPNGSVAWMVRRSGFVTNSIEVVVVDAGGRRMLDSGADVDAESLTLDGSTLSWQKAGATHSATLN